ncbi:DUF4157 domain-containing protein [uncultured Psychroserpens sp.]|uniref:eCIS core domain-containing protein n=1 Tax=uncultured Psychroserpens sp. TaxID=255436 RepID=UPI00261F1D1F|nr:DUF4157 domain-containing protein [uncultured Psychroserpens sp.]
MSKEPLHNKEDRTNATTNLKKVPAFISASVIQKKLIIGSQNDAYEKEADQVADQVVNTSYLDNTKSSKSTLVQRKCSACDEEQVQKKALHKKVSPLINKKQTSSENEVMTSDSVNSKISSTRGLGSTMDNDTKSFMENRFGRDFSDVRLHTDTNAKQLSQELNAQAFTVGNDIYFNEGKYNPESNSGKHLLAHELTHTIQQESGLKIQKKDDLCKTYNESQKISQIETQVSKIDSLTKEDKLILIKNLKWIIRCASSEKLLEIKKKLQSTEKGKIIWAEANTAFGGHSGMYSGYYSGGRSKLKNLGLSEIESFDAKGLAAPKTLDTAALESAARTEAPVMEATDILYFYGHQYAQYNHPGLFANGTQTQFIDLRKLIGKGDFSRVKLIISTSCATICKEAIEVFAPLFPNAVILGYRKSAPLEGGKVRSTFQKKIKALNKPLLLNQSFDVQSVIDVWKSTMKQYHPKEKTRLPGYYKGGQVYYLEMGTWKSMTALDKGNSCKKKGSSAEDAMD